MGRLQSADPLTHSNNEMANPEHLQKILEDIEHRPGVTRHISYNYEVETALQLMEMIGKRRAEKFRIDDENRWAYTQLIKWLYADPTMQAFDPTAVQNNEPKIIPGRLTAGIYIAGTTGTGKSWALEMLNTFAEIDKPRLFLGKEVKTIRYVCHRAEDIWEKATTDDEALKEFKNIPILCIQDLGSEPVSDAVRMGTRREPLRQILEARGDRNDLITLITSNFGIEAPEIEKRYTNRVVSRLREMCNLLVISGTDRRKL